MGIYLNLNWMLIYNKKNLFLHYFCSIAERNIKKMLFHEM